MNKQILSAAIALPIVMASAASSFASDAVRISQVTTTPVRTDAIKPALSNTVQPVHSEPLIQNGGLVNSSQASGEEPIAPGSGQVAPRPIKVPKPKRTDEIFQNPGRIVAPRLDSMPQNLNIDRVAPGR